MLSTPSLAILLASVVPELVAAWSFNIENTPQQCQNLSISITGSGGTPPFNAIVVPFGPSPLPNNTEVREVVYQTFDGNSTTANFKLPYPDGSQFVVVVSDATGFATGGTSGTAQIQSGSTDSSCFDPTTQSAPAWTYSIDPNNELIQCVDTRIDWDPTTTQGDPQFYGVIPGGDSFQIQQEEAPFTAPSEGLGFNWTVPIRAGTTVIVVGGDNRGIGSGGYSQQEVSATVSDTINNDCLDGNSPSSTPGSPAGGSYPTSSSGMSMNMSNSRSGPQTGTIVGAVIGGIVGGAIALAAVIFLGCRRSKRFYDIQVDLLDRDAEDHPSSAGFEHDFPPTYQIEPFITPDPTIRSVSYGQMSEADDRPGLSTRASTVTDLIGSGTSESLLHPGATSLSGGSISKIPPPQLRPVNIIEHDDAGPDQGIETVELPPAYTKIRRQLTQKLAAAMRPAAPDVAGVDSHAAAASETT